MSSPAFRMNAPRRIYAYGPLAWIWRALIFPALGASALVLFVAGRELNFTLVLVALPLLIPSVFFGTAVATTVHRDGNTLLVRTLLFQLRRIDITSLGKPVRRELAQNWDGAFHAPRMWIPVKGGIPVYLDLLTNTIDRNALAAVLRASV